MAEAKTKKTSGGDIVPKLNDVLAQMSQEAEAPTGDDRHDAIRRACILKLDAMIKFIEARW